MDTDTYLGPGSISPKDPEKMNFFGKNDYDKEVKTRNIWVVCVCVWGGMEGECGCVYLYISSKANSVWLKMTEVNIEISLD